MTADNTNGLDKESITADPTNPNLVYATWDRLLTPGGSTHASDNGFIHSQSYKSQTFFARSTNGGGPGKRRDSSSPTRRSPARSEG